MRKTEKRMLIVEILRGIGFFSMFFLIFWGQAQIIDPEKLFLITKVPMEVALSISITCIISALVAEKFASNKEQSLKKIKKRKIVLWTF